MLISGHKTRSIFDRYHIVSQTDIGEAVAKVEAEQHRMNTLGRCSSGRVWAEWARKSPYQFGHFPSSSIAELVSYEWVGWCREGDLNPHRAFGPCGF